MEDVETEQRISRKKRKLTTRQGVVIGVATVAGLGLVTKLFSFLRREKPKNLNDADLQSLEAVLSGDAAKSALNTPKFANLEEDNALYADQSTPETDATKHVDAKTMETTHFNGEVDGVKHLSDNEDAVELRNEDEVKQLIDDAVEPHLGYMEQEGHTKDVEELYSDNAKQLIEDAEPLLIEDVGKLPTEDVEKLPTADVEKLPAEDVQKLPIGDEGKHDSEDAGELQVEDPEEFPTEEGKHSVEAHTEDVEKGSNTQDALEHLNADAEKLVPGDKVKQFSEDAADAERLDTEDVGKHPSEDAVEPHIKDTERSAI